MIKGLEFREITNAKIATRLRQVIILAVVILAGILASSIVNAQVPRHRVFKAKNTCQQLARKRNETDNIKVSVKKVNYKPMAEREAPAAYRVSARRERDERDLRR